MPENVEQMSHDELVRLVYLLRERQAASAAEHDVGSAADVIAWGVRERDVLDALVENTHACLAYLDREFNFVRVNSAYAKGSGYSAADLIGRNHFDLFPHVENEKIFRQVRDSGVAQVFYAKPFTYPDQPERGVTYWDWVLAPIKGAGEQVTGLVLSLNDVTVAARAGLEREKRMRQLDLLNQVSREIMAHTTVDAILQSAADTARALTGAKKAACILGTANAGFRYSAASCAPETTAPDIERIRSAAQHWLEWLAQECPINISRAERAGNARLQWLDQILTCDSGLLCAQVKNGCPENNGFILLCDREQGDFTAEESALLNHLAGLASLGLSQLHSRFEAEKRAREMQAIFSAISDGVVVYDKQGEPVLANPAAVAIYGYDAIHEDADESVRRLAVAGADGAPASPEQFPSRRALSGETIRGETYSFVNKLGEKITFLASATPLESPDGIAGAVTVCSNVSELEKARLQVETERANLLAIFHAVSVGMLRIDGDGNVKEINRALRRWLDAKAPLGNDSQPGDILGCINALREPGGCGHGDECRTCAIRKTIQQVLELGLPAHDVETAVSLSIGGQVHPLWLLISADPVLLDGSRHVILAINDITHRKETEEALRRLAQFTEENPNPVLRVTLDGALLYANPRGRHWLRALHWHADQSLPQVLADFIARVHKPGRTIDGEIDNSDGKKYWVSATHPAGEDYVNIYSRDITRSKHAEAALQWSARRDALLSATAGKLLESEEPQKLVDELCRKVMDFLDCQVYFNYLVESHNGHLRLNACAGIPAKESTKIEWLDHGDTVCESAACDRRRIIVQDVLHTDESRTTLIKSYGVQAYCCHPLLVEGRLLGTLSFGSRTRAQFHPDDIEVMASVANLVAAAMNRVVIQDALRRSRDEMEMRVRERTAELERAMAELSAQRQRFQEVLDVLPAYVVLLTPDYRVQFANKFFRERFGESHSRRCYEFLFDRNEPCSACETYSVLKDKQTHRWEWSGPDGRQYDVADFPFTDVDGSTMILEMGIDITERRQAEIALRASEERYRDFLQNFQGIAFRSSIGFTPTFFHGRVEEITGYSEAEFLAGSPHWDEVIHPDDLPRISRNIADVRKVPGFATEREYRIIRKDGDIRWIYEQIRNIADETGKPQFIQGSLYDITEKKATENALVNERRRLYNLLEDLPAFIYVHQPDYTLSFVNREFRRRFGNPDGRPCYAVLRGLANPCKGCPSQEILQNKKPRDWEWVDGNGAVYQVYAYPFYDLDGSLSVLEMGIDITRRKEMEEELRRSEQRFRTLIKSLEDAVYTLDRQQKYVEVYGRLSEKLGVAPGAFSGKTAWEIFGEREAQLHREKHAAVFDGSPQIYEWSAETPHGVRYFQSSLAPLYDAHNNIEGIVGVARDITEQKQFDRRLIQTEKLLAVGEMAAMVSHEFRNALTSLGILLELQQESKNLTQKEKDSLAVAFASVKHMENVISQLLNFSRPVENAFEMADLNDLVVEGLAFVELQIRKQNVRVRQILDYKLPALYIDSSRLRESFINLVLNAVQAIKEQNRAAGDGEIRIVTRFYRLKSLPNSAITPGSAAASGLWGDKHLVQNGADYAVIVVTDNGCGIRAEHFPLLFNPFFTTKASGTGLGLAMVKRVVEAHGGVIRLKSRPGKGSSFTIYLPIRQHGADNEQN